MKATDLKNLTFEQLKAEEIKVRDELANLGLKTRGGQQKNVRAQKALRKTLARILTFLTIANNSSTKDS